MMKKVVFIFAILLTISVVSYGDGFVKEKTEQSAAISNGTVHSLL